MNQVYKFYLTSFLKNQTYFTPIFVIFLQSHFLSLQEIFWVFTIGSIFSFVIEIPTGVLADLHGKRRTIILGKLILVSSYVFFGFSSTFLMFIGAQILFELGNALRSGTETGFVYDYLEQNKNKPSYTQVKGKQKFYGRVGEAIATVIGGFLAAWFGFNWVFFIAAVPALVNFFVAVSFEKIKEAQEDRVSIMGSIQHTKNALIEMYKNKFLIRLTLNIMIFTAVIAAVEKYIQPYMQSAGISVELFGVIYGVGLGLSALAVRYAYIVENKFGTVSTINVITFITIIPAIILGFGWISVVGVALFFFMLVAENVRSPIANNLFNQNISSKQRATIISSLQLMKELGKSIVLPIAGFFTDTFSMSVAIMVLGGILLLNGLMFIIRKNEAKYCC